MATFVLCIREGPLKC